MTSQRREEFETSGGIKTKCWFVVIDKPKNRQDEFSSDRTHKSFQLSRPSAPGPTLSEAVSTKSWKLEV